MCCKQGLPRPDKSGLEMTEGWIPIPRFHKDRFHGNDREDKKLITPTLILPPRRGRRRKVIYHYHKQKNFGAGG